MTLATDIVIKDGYNTSDLGELFNTTNEQVNLASTLSLVWRPTASDVSQSIFVADADYLVTAVREVHGVASTSGTLNIEKLTTTTAPGSGTAMLTGTVSLSGTANTVASGTLTATAATKTLAAGDRIGGVLAGTLTNLVGCCVVVTLSRI